MKKVSNIEVYFRRLWTEIYYFKGISLGSMPTTFCGGKKGTRIFLKNTLNFVQEKRRKIKQNLKKL